jgi:hypothetical protein
MAKTFASQPEKTLTHVYVRDAQKGFVRPCWATGTELYCGMCMRGTIQPAIGAVCPICSSTVERILEVTPGGSPKLARKRGDCTIRVVREDAGQVSSGMLLDFLDSRKARA